MRIVIIVFLLIGMYSCDSTKRSTATPSVTFVPEDKNLYDTIFKLDSIFFGSYNTCDVNLDYHASFYEDNIEFYHDKGGVMNSKKDILEAIKNNVCGKVTRTLIPGSIEVYPIANYGAVEIGYHTFRNNTEKLVADPKPGRFVIIWRFVNNTWKVARVVSLH